MIFEIFLKQQPSVQGKNLMQYKLNDGIYGLKQKQSNSAYYDGNHWPIRQFQFHACACVKLIELSTKCCSNYIVENTPNEKYGNTLGLNFNETFVVLQVEIEW
jgi:hypothetical protein